MCTLAWIHGVDSYELFFNRDESRDRSPARRPVRAEQDGVRYLAPTDGDAGGTWLGVNEFGVSVGLLNAYLQDPREDATYESRGHLVRSLLDVRGPAHAVERLGSVDLGRFRGFRLAVFGPGEGHLFSWDGIRLAPEELLEPVVSSSYDARSALRARRRTLGEMRAQSPASMRAFLASHRPERGPDSVCMHREDARTVSASHLQVGPEEIAYHYCPGPPCRTAFDSPRTLARRFR